MPARNRWPRASLEDAILLSRLQFMSLWKASYDPRGSLYCAPSQDSTVRYSISTRGDQRYFHPSPASPWPQRRGQSPEADGCRADSHVESTKRRTNSYESTKLLILGSLEARAMVKVLNSQKNNLNWLNYARDLANSQDHVVTKEVSLWLWRWFTLIIAHSFI